MNISAEYYTKNLYPIQNGVLNLVKESGTPFFLTGGTALSRFYYNHRYSDDLDFFVHDDNQYSDYVKRILTLITKSEKLLIDKSQTTLGESHSRLIVKDQSESQTELQLDFVNDVANHYGGYLDHPEAGKIDGWENILTNKLTALFRSEPKDMVDIWMIANNQSFKWEEIVFAAKSKEVGIEPDILNRILKSFPISSLDTIKWVEKPDPTTFTNEMSVIADDILYGEQNSLH